MIFQNLCFELLQVAVGRRSCLSRTPSGDDWRELFAWSRKQALVGVCFYGAQKLDPGLLEHLPIDVKMQWLGMAVQIQQRNELMNRRCVEVQELLGRAGMKNCILKGQGIARWYRYEADEATKADGTPGGDLSSLRQSGDIDIWVDKERSAVIAFAKGQGDENPQWDYKHLHLKAFDDVEVEVHYVPEVFLNLWKNRRLQRWFRAHKGELACQDGPLCVPTMQFNLFYVLLHIYRHFLYEGVGLRQLMDYYFLLLHAPNHLHEETMVTMRRFGMSRFVAGVMWVMEEAFGLDREKMLCEPNEKEGRYILAQIIQGGNFGLHDERLCKVGGKIHAIYNILKHNLHLMAHYPFDVIWAPVWVVWHYLWKRTRRL